MESECFQTYKSLVSEVTKGMEQVKQLGASSSSNKGTVLEKMLASYEEALSILQGTAPEGQCQSVMTSLSDPHSSVSAYEVTQFENSSRASEKRNFFGVNVTSDGLPEVSDDGSSSRNYSQIDVQDFKRPRMTVPTLIHEIAVSSEASLDQPPDDGYKWRKYGQREILGDKYPRNYYRCDKKFRSGCPATKKVQRSSADPSTFQVTYNHMHTCQTIGSIPPETIRSIPPAETGIQIKASGVQFPPHPQPAQTTGSKTPQLEKRLSSYNLDDILDYMDIKP